MALSAAFSMARIIIGVANTGGSIASLNWSARCAGVTRSVKVPLAPSGIRRMRHHSWFAPDGSAPRPSEPSKNSRISNPQDVGSRGRHSENRREIEQRCARLPCRREDVHGRRARPPKEQCVDIVLILAAIIVGLFAAYNLFHYMLFLLVTHPRDAGNIG